MDLTDFNCNYLNKLLENISKGQKSIFLLGGFNVNLLNYNERNQTNKFLDSLASNSFIPLILQPTRITSHSNTLIDNVFFFFFFFFFSIWVFFHEHSRFTGQQGKGEGIYLTPLYHFHPLHRHLDISRAITAESSPLHIAGSRSRTGNLWFPSSSR